MSLGSRRLHSVKRRGVWHRRPTILTRRLSRAWARCRSKRGGGVRAWRNGRHGAWCRRRARRRGRWTTRNGFAPAETDRVNAPAIARATVIGGHSPAEPPACGNVWQVDYCRDEAQRVAAPCLTTCNRTAPISGDRTVVAARKETAASCKNVLEGISTIEANLQHASIKADVGLSIRRFHIEILPEGQLHQSCRKGELKWIEPFVA